MKLMKAFRAGTETPAHSSPMSRNDFSAFSAHLFSFSFQENRIKLCEIILNI